MDFSKALRQARKSAGMSQRAVALAIGQARDSSGYIGRIERGQITPKEGTKQRIVAVFGDKSVQDFCEESSSVPPPRPSLMESHQEVRVPVYKQNDLTPDWSNLGEPIMEMHVHAPGRDLVAVQVQTSSMYPRIPNGSIVMVDRRLTEPEDGKIGLFWANGRAVVRKIAYVVAGIVALQALDPEVAPIEMPAGALIVMGIIHRVIADPNG